MVGQPPSELLRHLEAERLRTLGVIWTQVDIDECPSVLVGDFAAEAIDVVVIAANRDDLRSVDRRADDFAGLDALGHEDDATQSRTRRMGRDRGREITGRRARDGGETK